MKTATKDRIRAAYLAGTSYCGSTLLAFLMDCHPQIASVGETSLYPSVQDGSYPCSCGKALPDCPYWSGVFRRVNEQGIDFSAKHWTNEYRYDSPLMHRLLTSYSSRPVVRSVQKTLAAVLPTHRLRVRRVDRVNVAFMRACLDEAGADVFFDTSKYLVRLYHLLQVPQIDMQVVRVIRDVRAFANSSRRNRDRPIEESTRSWMDYQSAVDDLVRHLPADKVLTLRYEDLCRDPATWFKALCRFLGVAEVELPQTLSSQEHHVIGNRMRLAGQFNIKLDESWKEALSRDEAKRILDVAGNMNARFGYVNGSP